MATQTDTRTVDLKAIASIDDLFLALRASFQGARIEVTTVDKRVFKLHVKALMHEDGSGRSFIISGDAQLVRSPAMKFGNLSEKKFKAYFNYKGGDRKGTLEIKQ